MMKDDTKNKSLNRKKNVDSKSPDMSEFVNPYWISYLISSYGRTRRINYKLLGYIMRLNKGNTL